MMALTTIQVHTRTIKMTPQEYRQCMIATAEFDAYEAAEAAGKNWRRCKREASKAGLAWRRENRV